MSESDWTKLNGTLSHSRHRGMDLGFPIPIIGKVSKTIKLLLRSE